MRFDEVLDYVGGAGAYQVCVMFFILALGLVSIDAIRMNFAGGAMEHWCKIPALANLSHDHQKYVGVPVSSDGGYSSCYRYPLNYSHYSLDELINWNRTAMTGNITEEAWLKCDAGWTYDRSQYISTISSKWDLVCDRGWQVQLISTLYMAGWMVGCIITGPFSDRLGRKTTVLCLHTLRTGAAFLCLYSPWYSGFAVGRVLMGICAPNVNLVMYVIVAEITSSRWRSTFGVSWNIVIAIGSMVVPGIAYFVRDHFYFEAIFIWPLIFFFILILVLDESPRWLVSQDRDDEAIHILHKVARVNMGTDEGVPKDLHFEEERKLRTGGSSKKGTFADLCRSPNIRKKTLILWLHWFTVSLVYYGLSLNAGRLPGSVYLNSFLLSVVEVPAQLISIFLISRIGRRWVTGGATVIGGVATLLCIPFIQNENLSTVVTALSVIGKACVSAGFGGIYVFTAELSPTPIRNIAFGTSSMFARISGMAAPFVGGPLADVYAGLPSILFGVFGLVAGSLIFLLPETLGAKLPETIEEAEVFGKSLPTKEEERESTRKSDGDSGKGITVYNPYTSDSPSQLKNRLSSTQL